MQEKKDSQILTEKNPYLLTCIECGEKFFTEGEKNFYLQKGLIIPKRCKKCRDKRKLKLKEQQEAQAIKTYPFEQIKMDSIVANAPEKALYIIGNGFDLIHGVPSSYYNFRDSLSRKSDLRFELETFIKKDDIWGNFEDSLAYLDRETLMDSVDKRMMDFDVLDEDDDDFSAANFFAAIEAATMPATAIIQELPIEFRRWINTLIPFNKTKPLQHILNPDARYINFNYTEFLETIYGIEKRNILYIHGDRRNKEEKLVLGHGHDIDKVFEEWYEANKNRRKFHPRRPGRKGRFYNNDNATYLAYFLEDERKGNWKSQARFDAINKAQDDIEEYYENSAKKTKEVLDKYKAYFEALSYIETIIFIGHSLSPVDYPYFKEMIRNNQKFDTVKWQVSWYSTNDLARIENFVHVMGISPAQIQLFRT